MSKASMIYSLPHNTKAYLDKKENDDREGVLCYCDDESNYGELRLVDNKGQAMIPKAATAKADVLFDGMANIIGKYTLSKSINNYQYILVQANAMSGGIIIATTFSLIPVVSNLSTMNQYAIGKLALPTYYYEIPFHFSSETTLEIASNTIVAGWTSPRITKVYGIK